MASEWRGLHPAGLGVAVLPRVLGALSASWPLWLALWFSNGLRFGLPELALLLAPIAVASAAAVVEHLTLRWRLDDAGRLELRTGWWTRTTRTLAADRIQHVQLVQRLPHRLFGLVAVEVQTASGEEPEVQLSALLRADGEALAAALGGGAPAAASSVPGAWLTLSTADLVRYGATSTGWSAAAVGGFALLEVAQQRDPVGFAAALERLGVPALVALAVALLTGAWLFGIGTALVRYWGIR